MKAKHGQKVYIPELDKIGRVTRVTITGHAAKVAVKNKFGQEEIIDLIVTGYKVYPLIKHLWNLIKGIFKK